MEKENISFCHSVVQSFSLKHKGLYRLRSFELDFPGSSYAEMAFLLFFSFFPLLTILNNHNYHLLSGGPWAKYLICNISINTPPMAEGIILPFYK